VNAVLPGLQLFALAAVTYAAIGALAVAAALPWLGPMLQRWEPGARHRAVVMLAALPAGSALVLLLAASLPSVLALAAPGLDHCTVHGGDHAHLCFVHLPEVGIRLGLLGTLAYLFLRAGFRLVRALSRYVHAGRLLAGLERSGEKAAVRGLTLVEVEQPLCVAAGLFKPRILMSRILFERLTVAERRIVVAHEHAHVLRRDLLVGAAVRALTALQLPSASRWLRSELEVAAEQACDEAAAADCRDRLVVAATILKVERAMRGAVSPAFGPFALAFGLSAVERRVESLLRAPAPPRSVRLPAGLLGGAVVAALLLADELHHLSESILSFIAH
jgi:hypothetical protein